MNNEVVQLKAERRLSLKIIAHKIRRRSPFFLYEFLLAMRYAFFKRKCSGIDGASASYSDGSWIDRKTSSDLVLIQKFLEEKQNISVLQIGTGNMSFYKSLKTQMGSFYGVTIMTDEVDYARRVFAEFADQSAKVFQLNKYTADYAFLNGKKLDFIVDNDLSSYACCIFHFDKMISSYANILKPGGAILVGLKGLGYFDTGFGLTYRKLEKLAEKLNLKVEESDYCYHLIKL